MPNDLFHVRADMVDDKFWIETSATRAATVQLHATLEMARKPDMWMPFFCLSGPEGSGKTALAHRVVRQARRNVSCRLGAEAVARGGVPEGVALDRRDAIDLARAIADDFGHCPSICSPVRLTPIGMSGMWHKPDDKGRRGVLMNGEPTPGDLAGDPLRRTSMVLVDDADHLLNVSEAKQRLLLAGMAERAAGRLTYVFIGSPKLASALARHGRTQLIPLPGLPEGAEFARVVEMVFGTLDAGALARIHKATRGCMGPLMHMAAMEGLEPPFRVPERELARLPAPNA